MTIEEPRWRRALGAALFVAGLCVWIRVSLESLPYTYHDLHYLFSLDAGYGPVEWVHPLFVPALGALRRALALFGFSGPLLLPLERLNLAVGTLTLCALFPAAARLCRDSVAAAACVLWIGFSGGFWAGVLRPDPYALAAAFATVSLLLFVSPRPGGAERRYALAGLAAGAAFGFHAAMVALLPAAAAAAWAEAGFTRRGASLLGRFGLCLAAAVVAGYAILIGYHAIPAAYFRGIGAAQLFGAVEQMPGTSIYTSGDLFAQARGLAETLLRHGGAGLPFLLAVEAAALIWIGGASRTRATAAALGSAVFSTLFFLLNNSQNGFVYVAFLSAPLLLQAWEAAAVPWRRWAGPLTLAAAAVCLPSSPLPDGPAGDPLFAESRYLRGLLRTGDLLVLPGCPFPELMYERRFNAIQAGELAMPGDLCVVPAAGFPALDVRVRYVLSRGRSVYFASGQRAGIGASEGDAGFQKREQPFATRAAGADERLRAAGAVRRALESSHVLECGLNSPNGWSYCRASSRPGRPASVRAEVLIRSDVEAALARFLGERPGDFQLKMRAGYLAGWLDETPDDPYVLRDLAALLPQAPARRAAAARAAALVEEGISHHRRDDAPRAERAFREALRADPTSVSAWLSLGAVLDRSGRHREALICYDRILELAPAQGDVRADTLAARAHALGSLGRPGQARRSRLLALQAASSSWPWRKDLENLVH